MSGNKTASILVLVIGIGLLAASLLADVIGIGDDPGFGNQQTMGSIAGASIGIASSPSKLDDIAH